MSFPADIPNPNQNNVYYSLAALSAELLNYFEKSKVDAIKLRMKDYYLPSFVFDSSSAPSVYNLDVYPKGKGKEGFQIDTNGNIVDAIVNPTPALSVAVEENLADGAFKCTLDPKFHSSTLLKEPNDLELPIDSGLSTGIDLLVSTKFIGDEEKLENRVQNYSILKNLLLERLKGLPSEELEAIKKRFIDTVESIDGFKSTLSKINEGQEKSLTDLEFESFVGRIYKETGTVSADRKSFAGTRMLLAQALSDLGNSVVVTSTGYPQLYKGKVRVAGSFFDNTNQIKSPTSVSASSSSGTKQWPLFLNKLQELGLLDEIETTVPRTSNNVEILGGDIDAIQYYGTPGDDASAVFSLDGRPKEWYYSNFVSTIKGEETEWGGLNGYLKQFDATVEPYVKKVKQMTLGGGQLLVDQAIMKSILDLCMTNIDVSEFAPRVGQSKTTISSSGTNFFSFIGRSGALGPSGTTPYPSKYTMDPEDYQVKPYTNSAFLCYYAIIQIIRSVSDSANKEFLEDNLKEHESNHDAVIDLLEDVHHSSSLEGSTSNMYPTTGSTVTSRNMKQLMHAYKRFETFPANTDVILIPNGDGVPASERSFVQYYIRRPRHTTEQALNASGLEVEKYFLLNDDDDFAVSGSPNGKLNLGALPDEYGFMGYIGNDEAINFMRTYKVNYGFGSQTNSKDVTQFYKQRRYSMPYFWASMTSLWRAITVGTWKNLIDSINDLAETDIEMTKEEILEHFDHNSLWYRIRELVKSLETQNDIKFRIYCGSDGALNFCENNQLAALKANSVEYRNTPGLNTKKMLQGWVRFVSLVSNHSSIQVVDSHKPIEFDYQTYLAAEAIATQTNQNFANNHGGSSQYLQPVFSSYFDKLEVTQKEYEDKLPIKKSDSPIGESIDWLSGKVGNYLQRTHVLYKHTLMFDHIRTCFRNMEDFVKGFDIEDSVKPLFTEGEIDIREEIQDPAGLIEQISDNQTRYSPNEFGLGGLWNWNLDPKALIQKSKDEGWLYIHVVGLDKEAWNGQSTLTMVPEYVGATSSTTISEAAVTVQYRSSVATPEDLLSEQLLRYIHLDRGLHLHELTFSNKAELIYSDELIRSESGVFPWEKDDFKKGKPKKPLETLFNMSPWLFPKNYFYDVCLQNKYHRVFACVVSEQALANAGVGVVMEDEAVEDVVGSIRWKIQ